MFRKKTRSHIIIRLLLLREDFFFSMFSFFLFFLFVFRHTVIIHTFQNVRFLLSDSKRARAICTSRQPSVSSLKTVPADDTNADFSLADFHNLTYSFLDGKLSDFRPTRHRTRVAETRDCRSTRVGLFSGEIVRVV